MTANITLGLRGLVIENGQEEYISDAADRAYKQGSRITKENIKTYNQEDIANILTNTARRLTAVLRGMNRGNPMDSVGQPIDSRLQIDELGYLSQATRNMEKITRDFLGSDLGKAKWNNGILITLDRIVNVEHECIGLSKLVKRMEVAQVNIRRQIDRENVMVITLILGPVLYADILGIIGQYME